MTIATGNEESPEEAIMIPILENHDELFVYKEASEAVAEASGHGHGNGHVQRLNQPKR